MKTVSKTYNVYLNLGYWFLGFIVLVFLGFYKSYFSVLLQPKDSLIHLHFLLMMVWVCMVIAQPFLIKYKKLKLHRLVGRLSYVIVPLILITSFLMMRFSYYNYMTAVSQELINNAPRYSTAEVLRMSARSIALPFIYILWMLLFYSLAIINRRRSVVHSRYMLATALTLIGPTVDRIFIFIFNILVFPFGIPFETFSYVLIDIILAFLLWKDYRENRNTKTLSVSLGIYVIGQLLYFIGQDTVVWERLVTIMMQPAL